MNPSEIPNDHTIYDADDNVLVAYMAGRREEMLAVARDAATKRQECVYVYGNGRETVEPAPTVGCPATLCWITDRQAGTVIAVSPGGRKVVVQLDKARRTDKNGMSECQSYEYERDPEGRTFDCYLDGAGRYKHGTVRLVLGARRSYHDYSF